MNLRCGLQKMAAFSIWGMKSWMTEYKTYQIINIVFVKSNYGRKNDLLLCCAVFFWIFVDIKRSVITMKKFLKMILCIMGSFLAVIVVFWICISYTVNYKKTTCITGISHIWQTFGIWKMWMIYFMVSNRKWKVLWSSRRIWSMPQSDPPQAENPAKQDSFLSYRKDLVTLKHESVFL